jgi:DNA polymerase III sliding clamp (beta) subunit (PCNA family)
VAEFPNQTTLGTLTDGGEGIFRGFYAADDNGLLSAIRLDAKAGALVVSGTNRYRMATMTAAMEENRNENSFSLPKGTASLITKLFKGKTVTVTCNDRYLGFSADTLQVICITLAAMPPDLTQVIPHDYATMITMPTKTFRKEVKACRSTCDANSFGRLAIKPEENVVHISSSEANAGQTFIEVEGLNGHGPALELGVNLKYLEDALSHVTGDAAILAVPAGGSLLAVLPQFGNGEFHVIMPMVLR